MRIDNEPKLDYNDVLLRPKRSTLKSRSEVDINREYTFKNGNVYNGTPIIAANMDTTGTIEISSALNKFNLMTALHKHYSLDELLSFYNSLDDSHYNNTWYSIGMTDTDLKKLTKFADNFEFNHPKICIDVANGYSEHFVEFVKMVRSLHPTATIMAGNVVTGEMTEELILSGADVVKVGIGPGSVCTTRMKTGVGYPQLSAVIECADAAHGLGGHICADGGITCAGDVAKAFGAGADFVMIGGMFSGHDESGGEIITEDGKQYKLFYGMSSDTAMTKHNGGVAEYRASEGKTVKVPYRGPIDGTIQDILGGLRSACTYVGACTLKELSKRTTFIRVSGKQQLNNIFS